MKYIHEQTQPLATDSIVANSMNIYNVISIYMVTVTITPDAAASRGNRHPGDKDYFHRNGDTHQFSSTYTSITLENEIFRYRNCLLYFGWC